MAARPSAFDYATLKPDEADLARHAAGVIREQSAIELRAINAWLVKGAILSKVHGAFAHGSWLPWLKAETDISTASAERMIRAADMITGHAKFVTMTNLPPIPATLAYRLSAKQTPQSIRDEFVPRLIDGEQGLAKLITAALKPPKPEPEAKPDTDADVEPSQPSEAARRHWASLSSADRDHLRVIARNLPKGVTLDSLARAGADDAADAAEASADPETIIDTTETAADTATETEPSHTFAEETAEPDPEPDPDPAPRPNPPRGSGNVQAAINRIRALRAKTVANGCTEAEALAAAAKAAELIDRYALSMSDLEFEAQTCEQRTATDRRHDVERTSGAIAEFTGCRTWIADGRIVYFGLPHNVEVAEFLTDLCRSAIDTAWRVFLSKGRSSGLDGRTERKAFMTTMADRLADRLHTMAADRNRSAKTGDGTSLVVLTDAIVTRQLDALGLEFKRFDFRAYDADPETLRAAHVAANRVNLTTGIETGSASHHIG